MRLNIESGYVSLDKFKQILNSASNLKDVHLLCHQAGCPVYVVRDINDKCAIMWHPCTDETRNTLHIVINDGIFGLLFEGEVYSFSNVEQLREKMMTNHMLGDTPFDSEYVVWSKS